MALNFIRRPVKGFPVNPRMRAYGKARLDIASRVQTPSDWEKLWKRPAYPFPFTWGVYWKQCIEYKVDDFPAEVGFFTDFLGLPVNALDPGYAMFTSPGGDFFIAIVPTPEGMRSTPQDAIRIQFMVADVFATARELEQRGISLEQWPQPCADGSDLFIGYFRTPHGICVDLWGLVEAKNSSDPESPPALERLTVEETSQGIRLPNEEVTDEFAGEVDSPRSDGQRSSEHSEDMDQDVQVDVDELEVEYVNEEST
jgi:catechol 2,3-dioxygenase-like lactoylglutathione lyase family enzyme